MSNSKFLAFVALLLLSRSAIHAAEIHVATGGSDTNPGPESSPFRTIQHAASVTQPGDVVTVHHGGYRERITACRAARLRPKAHRLGVGSLSIKVEQ